MKYLITVSHDKEIKYQIIWTGRNEPSEELYIFLNKHYPSKSYSEQTGNPGEYETVLRDRMAGMKVMWHEGETEAITWMGKISIREFPEFETDGFSIGKLTDEITPSEFQANCALEWNKLVREDIQNRHGETEEQYQARMIEEGRGFSHRSNDHYKQFNR